MSRISRFGELKMDGVGWGLHCVEKTTNYNIANMFEAQGKPIDYDTDDFLTKTCNKVLEDEGLRKEVSEALRETLRTLPNC